VLPVSSEATSARRVSPNSTSPSSPPRGVLF
jgi:hypothetical protein